MLSMFSPFRILSSDVHIITKCELNNFKYEKYCSFWEWIVRRVSVFAEKMQYFQAVVCH